MPKGFQLAIESSAAQASVALGCDQTLLFASEFAAGRRPSEVLVGPVEEALSKIGEGEIDLVLIGTGPGSYNGARVGIAVGQGVALVHRCPVVGLCSLEALSEVRAGAKCLAVGDARRGTYFTMTLCGGKLSASPDLLERPTFLQQVAAAEAESVTLLTLEDPSRLDLPDSEVALATPSAPLLLESWWAKNESEKKQLLETPPEPFYLRPPHITQPK